MIDSGVLALTGYRVHVAGVCPEVEAALIVGNGRFVIHVPALNVGALDYDAVSRRCCALVDADNLW